MEKLRVAFIGLGVMGYPMAGYLSKAGFETKVYNRTKAKADKWAEEYQGVACETPREAAEGCDIVLPVWVMMMTFVALFTVKKAFWLA